jgi:hypothetical protein
MKMGKDCRRERDIDKGKLGKHYLSSLRGNCGKI